MWPRLLEQLFDLLPHLTRLVPLADRYFTTRSAAEPAHAEDLATLRIALGDLTHSHDRLTAELTAQTPKLDHIAQQVAAQSQKLDHLSSQVDLNRTDLSSQSAQLQTVTQQLKRLQLWTIATALLSALLLLALLFLLLFRNH
jgi:septal ring factor EnvC (AmiA/AmiB activator)